jgi:hypothetical protein
VTDHRAWPTGEHLPTDHPGADPTGATGRHAAPPGLDAERVADIVAEEAAALVRDAPPADPGTGRHRTVKITPPSEPAPAPDGEDEPPISIADTVREQLGGVRGLVESSLPVLVFIVVNLMTTLKPALWAAVGSAVLVALYRLIRRDSIRHAVNGLLAVGVAAFIAARTGRAADFYIINILRNSAGMLLFGVSVLVRRPLVGYVWRFVAEIPTDWRERPALVRAFSLSSLVWAAMFAIRAGVQIPLWIQNNADALGVVSILLGWPLFGAALGLTVWAGRRAMLADEGARDEGARDEGARDEGARDEGARDEGAPVEGAKPGAAGGESSKRR